MSATLFLISINSLVKQLGRYVYSSLFVDDCRISIVSYDLETAQIKLQSVLNKFERWCAKTGFSFSPRKCKILICHHKNRVHPQKIKLHLNNRELECVSQFKF